MIRPHVFDLEIASFRAAIELASVSMASREARLWFCPLNWKLKFYTATT